MRNFALVGSLGTTVAVSLAAGPAPASEGPLGGEASLGRSRVATKTDVASLGSRRCRFIIVIRAVFGHNKTVTTASGTSNTWKLVASGASSVGAAVIVAREGLFGS